MAERKQLRLGAFMRPVGIHTAWWRYPGADPNANFDIKRLVQLAQKLEEGKFDAFFAADHLAVLNMPIKALMRSATVTSFDPMILLPALAMATERLGLIATGSTTFDAPFHIARRFASLDHISGGRAGWNIVTTSNPDAALNFGLEEHVEHDERYRRAREFYDVVTGLWDSWADDAFKRDVDEGLFFDPDKMRRLDHKGKYYSVRGPLNVARPIQGWPVIVQAGASEAGRQLAAETAEAIFASSLNLEGGKKFYADVKGRMRKLGRDPDDLKILPACFVVIGDTVEEAKAKRAKLDSLVHYDSGIASLSIQLGTDASKFDPDGPLPEIPQSNASQSGRDRMVEIARRENFTVQKRWHRAPAPITATPWLARPRPSPTRWNNGSSRKAATLQHPVFPCAWRSRRIRRSRRARIATAWHFPQRIRGQDVARQALWRKRPENPVLPNAKEG